MDNEEEWSSGDIIGEGPLVRLIGKVGDSYVALWLTYCDTSFSGGNIYEDMPALMRAHEGYKKLGNITHDMAREIENIFRRDK